ncbi:hypothetical protein DPD44_21100 [Salmonella enterica subsp. enterica serovar Poona]|nr:hypothetical protein [Salmonella enterica subsp. enterica serovar Poona]
MNSINNVTSFTNQRSNAPLCIKDGAVTVLHGGRRIAFLQKIHCLSQQKLAAIKNNNQNTLQAFTNALENEYGFVISPSLNKYGSKALTGREAQRINAEAKKFNILKKMNAKPENYNDQRLAFWPSESVSGSIRFINEFGKAQLVDSVAKIKENCSENVLRFADAKSAYCNLADRFTEENLKSFVYAIYAFAAKNENLSLSMALVNLLNVKVGPSQTPFKNLIKLNKISMDELKPIISELGKLLDTTLLSKGKICAPVFETIPFSDMTVEPLTQVCLKNGTPLAVNMLSYNNENVALARSYPMRDGLENHFKMLMEQKCKHLVVLTPQDEIDNKGYDFCNYFSMNGKYGDISVSVKNKILNKNESRYTMEIKNKNDGTMHSLEVIHVNDWKDKSKVDVEHLISLASELNLDGVPPAIHCLGGVGRTGTLAVAMQMLKSKYDTALTEEYIKSIIEKFRHDRNDHMVQGAQWQLLAEMARKIETAPTFSPLNHEYVNIGG